MEYNSFLQKCHDDDVLELDNSMIKLSKLKSDLNLVSSFNYNSGALIAIANYVKSPPFSKKDVEKLFNDGVDANVLRIGSQGWKKGKIKVKITLEFCPEEPEIEGITQSNNTQSNQTSSPLDDIRQMMNKNN